MLAKAKLTDEQVKTIRRRLRARERLTELAAEYGVNRKTIRRRLDALERAGETRGKRLLGPDERNPKPAPEQQPEILVLQGERRDPPPPCDEQPDLSGPLSGQPSTARLEAGGVPIFPNTREGHAERFAYYDARKLNHLPDSLYDYYDVIHGRETPAERRARERGASGRPR